MSTWLPIGSKSSLPKKQTRMKIANKNYVVWKNPVNHKWSVLRDVCSHRLAPLSQGRIDTKSGCIECPYHGWQFSTHGTCVKILQALDKEQGKSVQSIDVMETGDILWGKFDIENAQYTTKPNIVFPELDDVKHVMSRELPYSFDFLVENFMDPAHIPFAHHGLQGLRSDGIHIPMKVLTHVNDSSKLEINFKDRIRGSMRNGIVSFVSPAYYHFRVLKDDTYKIQLMVLITPVTYGSSRIHLAFLDTSIPNILPKWISHSFAHRFLETDIWLHNCEIEASKMNNNTLVTYDLPTTSDTGAKIWRKWWMKHMSLIPIYSYKTPHDVVELNHKQQRDRTAHIETCIHCQNALSFSHNMKKFRPMPLCFVNKKPLLSVLTLLALRTLSNTINKMVHGHESI